MNKKDWKDGLTKLLELKGVAERNIKVATDQAEELEVSIQAYRDKINTLK
jgi:hypothetical protein